MPDAGTVTAQWLAALEQRHLANLTKQEFTRAVRALSARYVERRGQLPDRSPLDSAGKRAAFALFYAPLHFLTAEVALARSGVRTDLTALVDLGCGTGVCGAAWARAAAAKTTSEVVSHATEGKRPQRSFFSPAITGVDANAWAVDEARWNWRTLGLRGHAVRGDLLTAARGLLRQSNSTLATTGIIAGWTINELAKNDRDQLLDVLDQLLDRGATTVVLEPLARGVAPWWEEWATRLAPRGVHESDVKAEVDLPAPLDAFSDAAGFRKKELGVRVMYVLN